ncbi:MAG: DUF1353 domain-containing protein [Candidatus Paceibacterota bacterium]
MANGFFGEFFLKYKNGEQWEVVNPQKGGKCPVCSNRVKDNKKVFGYKYNGMRVIIPNLFKTNFASVPGLLHAVLPPTGKGNKRRYGKAAVIHDWLYWMGKLGKELSDTIFRDAMKVSGVNKVIRECMYWAVKFFGFVAWKKHRKKR